MIPNIFVLLFLANSVLSKVCYWNDGCAYQLYSTKTPYDVVRGDIRDYPIPRNCRAVSLWSINQHGNQYPDKRVTPNIRAISNLKQEIIDSFYAGRGELCAQDIENFKKWKWNKTLDSSQTDLTGIGYKDLYDIGKRLREKYPHLLELDEGEKLTDHFYFRPASEQKAIISSMAFVHGLGDTTNFNFTVDDPWPKDDVVTPYENCDKYQQEVKEGPVIERHMDDYYKSQEFIRVQQNVQKRLGINTSLSPDDVYSLYELCRFLRSWEPDLRSPWCAAFSYEDLIVLEYKDDVKHYYRNGYGSKINVKLGSLAVKDLFERFNALVQGRAHRLVAYFTYDTMIEMIASAIGLFSDGEGVIQGAKRDPNRQWRSSYIGCSSSNILAILNSCEAEPGNQTSYKVQLFYNEKVTDLCPLEGCPWQEFHDKFKGFTDANLQFCAVASRATQHLPGSASAAGSTRWMLIMDMLVVVVFRSL